jgi:hypothetical protein
MISSKEFGLRLPRKYVAYNKKGKEVGRVEAANPRAGEKKAISQHGSGTTIRLT